MTNWAQGKRMYEILVPASNREQAFSYEHHKTWDSFVTKLIGGITIGRATKGTWVDRETGEEYKDRMIPVKVACTPPQIRQIMNFTLTHYNQIEVIAYPISEEIIIVRKT